MATTSDIERHTRDDPMAGAVAAICDVLVLCAIVLASVPLFLHGWVHVTVQFVARNPSGAGLLQRVGGEVDRQFAALADNEVRAAIAPTMWQDHRHIFQILFASLLLIAVVVVCLPLIPGRWRIRARGGACLLGITAAAIVTVAVLRIAVQINALPDRITTAIDRNTVLKQSLTLTNAAPHVSGGPGWPVMLTIAGVALVLLGTLVSFIATVRTSGRKE